MKSIKENVYNLYEIEKSKFHTFLYRIDDKNDVKKIINNLKKEYKGANHYCYAYIIDSLEKASDDGEPNKTAGLPILNILKQNNLDHILCVVIRYFGGIKLGAGGLIRSYAESTKLVLNKSSIITLLPGYLIKIIFEYDNIKEIDYILKDINIVNKKYGNEVTYSFYIKKINEHVIVSNLKKYVINYENIKEMLI